MRSFRNFIGSFLKNLLWLFPIITGAFTFGAASQAAATTGKIEEKSLQLWGEEIQYSLKIQKNSALEQDGESFLKKGKKGRTLHVVLNPVYFSSEAKALFERLSQEKKAPAVEGDMEQWKEIEGHLLAGRSLSPELREVLRGLKSSFETAAWREVFQDCLPKTGSHVAARACFVEAFTQTRLRTIEYHEVSHLLDLRQAAGESESPDFERDSELKAFFTELKYGENPLDVMAQALAGYLDEAQQGKSVDFSTLKVRKVLEFTKKHRKFASRLKAGKNARCCLDMLREMALQDYQLAGQELYRLARLNAKPSLASLR